MVETLTDKVTTRLSEKQLQAARYSFMPKEFSFFNRYIAPVIGACLGLFIALWFWPFAVHLVTPLSNDYNLIQVDVENSVVGAPVPVRVVREINTPFFGEYLTVVREVGNPLPICDGGKKLGYKPTNNKVIDVDVAYWTEGAEPPCMDALYAGSFVMSTCIIKYRSDRVTPSQSKCVDSNVFTIYPDSETYTKAEGRAPRYQVEDNIGLSDIEGSGAGGFKSGAATSNGEVLEPTEAPTSSSADITIEDATITIENAGENR